MPRSPQLARAILLALTAGCATLGLGGPPPVAQKCALKIGVRAHAEVNPDEQGRSLPTVMRFLQLNGTARLENSSFDDVWEHADTALADELLDTTELTVYPAEIQSQAIMISPAATHLAVVALFRDPVGTQWRRVATLHPARQPGSCAAKGANRLDFDLIGTRVAASTTIPTHQRK